MPVRVMREAYSHEVSSCGFWGGSEAFPEPIFYAYCYPTPPDFKDKSVFPAEAQYNSDLGEFILKYADVQKAQDPERYLMEFLQSTYDAAADSGKWDREALDCDFSSFDAIK